MISKQAVLLLGFLFGLTAATCDDGWQSFGNACYHAITGYATYASATSYCNGFGATVVTIYSAEEQAFVDGLFTNPDRAYWIGFNGNSSGWYWVDGGASTYTNWRSGRPTATSSQCIMAGNLLYDGKWTAVDCATRNQYCGVICKKYASTTVQPTTTVITTTTATGTDVPVACSSDSGCNFDKLCQYGVCAPPTGDCTSDADCPEGQTCRYLMCGYPAAATTTVATTTTTPSPTTTTTAALTPCKSHSECDFTSLCSGDVCVPYGDLVTCGTTGDCVGDQTCDLGYCVDPSGVTTTVAATPCSSDLDCDINTLCQHAICVASPQACTSASTCPTVESTEGDPYECRYNQCALAATSCTVNGAMCGTDRICSGYYCVLASSLIECGPATNCYMFGARDCKNGRCVLLL